MREPAIPTQRASGYQWELLVLLWIAFFLHQGDRQIYNSVLSLVGKDLGLDDEQLGLVGTIFSFVYGILVPVAGFAGDRLPRKWIVVFSLLIFSGGTLCSGLSTGLIMLIVFRSATTGGGEAFFYPAATSLLAQWHEKTRAVALGLLQTAVYLGITVSGFVAGYLGEHYGWRSAFFSFGGFGLLWSIVVMARMRNTPAISAGRPSVPIGETLAYIARRPCVWLLSIAFGAMVCVNLGYLTWTPEFLRVKFDLSRAWAGFNSMIFHHAGAFIGVLFGGKLADTLVARRPSIRMEMNFIGLLFGAPFIYFLGQAETEAGCYTALALFGLFRGFYDSNLFASLFDVVAPRFRSSAAGLMLAFAFVVGSISPVALGWAKPRFGLAVGLSSLSVCYVFGACCILFAIVKFLRRDYVADPGSSS